MTADDPYGALAAHLRRIAALEQVDLLLSWDQETVMPPKGGEQRAEQRAAIEAALHDLRADPRIEGWAHALADAPLAADAAVNVAEARRMAARARRVPAELSAEIARQTARAQTVWAAARAARDFEMFSPTLSRVVALKREEAACLTGHDEDPYDALLDLYEPGAKSADLAAMLGRLRDGLTGLRERIAERGRGAPRLSGSFPAPAQLALAREAATAFGYDWSAGRLDLVTHPFCAGQGGDVRMTTRVDEADPLNCLYSTIHETGHALYEQGVAPELALAPAGKFASMGVHESQSRLLENQIGRGRAFCDWLQPRMLEAFGPFGVDDPEMLYRAVNRVEAGFIRTEADEVHYNLHVLMRFDLERALIRGELDVAHLESAWNQRVWRDFGLEVDHAANGVLQDVHWSIGLFGYFPTYALGNIYAAELYAAMLETDPHMEARIAAGDFAEPVAWLRARVHAPGRLNPGRETISRACGREPDETALLSYLETKFGALYGL